MCIFSLARCSDLYAFNEVVCSRYFVYLEHNPLSYMYFVNIFFCGLCLSFVNEVFHSLNL
ncbi:hypothetical protein ANAPC2_01332 [Anaplasma phagocytophilum]|nr:hypothetical protein ANAPC2_01332 [Anaplasma phagocytophilum]